MIYIVVIEENYFCRFQRNNLKAIYVNKLQHNLHIEFDCFMFAVPCEHSDNARSSD